jgi:hypothetical protein
MNVYRKFVDGLVMNYYNELTKDKNEVLFDPSYEMSGIRGAVKIMVFSMIASVVLLPSGTSTFFVWLFLCSYIYKGAVESKMGSGYPYLEGYLGLLIRYLIAAPIAAVIHFVFFGGYEYLADLADLSQREGFFARLLVLFVAWISYMFLFRNNKWDNRNKEWIKEFSDQEQKMKEGAEKTRSKNGTYKDFIKSLDEKFTLPKDIKNTEQIKDPVVSKKRLNSFVKWVYDISTDDKRPNLANLLNNSKKLEFNVPKLSISINQIVKDQWSTSAIEILDEELSTYVIYNHSGGFNREFDNKKWVTIINNPNVASETCDEIYGEESWIDYDSVESEKIYLEDEDFYIPYDLHKEVYDYDTGYYSGNINLYCIQRVGFWRKDIIINGSKFKFKEDEEKHLVTLLMASYKPSLLKRILKELEK